MVEIEKFIEHTNAAKTSGEVYTIFENTLISLGYDRFCYSIITDQPSSGLKAGHGIMRNYPDDWMHYYTEKSYEHLDPVPKYCFLTNAPFTWEHVTALGCLSEAQRKVMNEAKEAKLFDGIAVPMYGINGELSGVGLASSSGGIKPDKHLLSVIRIFCLQFHLAYTERECTETHINTLDYDLLTSRETEILSWAAEGKSDADIADIIGISYPTVRFHLNNAYKKLGANERIFAVTKAIRHGLILPRFMK